MVETNEFERDLEDQAGLKRPGRIDLRVFQNTPDAGDGHPGIQRCFRNYLHEGGMEKDLDLIGYGIKGTSVDINNAELQHLSNISPAQWVFVGEADQPVKIGDSPTFDGLTLSADVVTTSTFDGVDVGDLKTDYDAHLHNGNTLQLDNINSDGGAFSFTTTGQVTFSQNVSVPNLITTGNVDGVNISNIKLNSMPSAADGDIDANTQKIIGVVNPVGDQDAATKKFVDDHNWNEADITDLDKYSQAQVNAFTLNKWAVPTADISMNTHKITGVVDPVGDQDVATKKSVEDTVNIYVASDDLVFSNDTERTKTNLEYVKVKEIICRITGNIRVYWEHKYVAPATSGKTRLYLNGSYKTVGFVATNDYTPETGDINVKKGDLIQVYGYAEYGAGPTAGPIYVQNMRIKYAEFTNNDP